MYRIVHLSYLIVLFVAGSCGQGNGWERPEQQQAVESLEEAMLRARELAGADERLAFWKERLNDEGYRGDPVTEARIYYELAGVYYEKSDLDSIKWHMQQAWEQMEGVQGHEELMVLLYSGEGNIATIERNPHQANYYFNRAARILEANPVLEITARQKANIFLATAQADASLFQFEQSTGWNKKAMAVLFLEAPGDVQLLYRAYSQLAADYLNASGGSPDSAYRYIGEMEQLAGEHPGTISPRFLYDRKALYFDKTDQPDSSLVYHRKKLEMDLQDVAAGGTHPTLYSNLFKDYVALAIVFNRLSQNDSTGYYLDLATSFIEDHGHFLDDTDYITYRKALIAYFFDTDRFRDAFEQYNILFDHYETLFENEYAQAIAEMSTIYELQAKERSILELNEQVLVAENRLRQNRLFLVITALAALLAFVIAILLHVVQKQHKLRQETEKIQLQKNAIELEQRLLRTQMEPHFIFNTLSALQSYVRLDEKGKALKYLNQFSRLLRNSLKLSRESLVPLEEEMDTLEYYLSLQQMRYDNSFDYRVRRPPAADTDRLLIPPMLIQPFVENAIVHGMRGIDYKGLITIDLRLRETCLDVTITDNGPGIGQTAGKSTRQKTKTSLSTTISRERLDILAREKGFDVSLTTTNRQDLPEKTSGTRVELTIPVGEGG